MPPSLSDPVKLPCGLVLPSRLSKAAMAELMVYSNQPTAKLVDAYKGWAVGGWGSIITGYVQVDVDHLGTPFDVALHIPYTGHDPEKEKTLLSQWKHYAETCQQNGVPTIVQICHPGRQSLRGAGHRGFFANTLAPSAVPMAAGDEYLQRIGAALAWTWPKEMTHVDIKMVIQQFVDTARLMADAGFKGVELHSAHGYLLDQFLNAKTNLRTDEYGGSPERRARFVLEVLSEIRKVVPPTFCVGIKLNSADHSSATFEDTMTQIRLLVDAGVDFMEISGGSYEDPKMMGYPKDSEPKSSRTAAREAFFLEFAKEVRKRHPDLVLMLTGGFRTREGAESAIAENACDLVGIARPAAVNPSFANILLDKELPAEKAQLWLDKVRPPFYSWFLPRHISGGGAETTYYAGQINRLAKGLATYAP